jgi:hypothetical protein
VATAVVEMTVVLHLILMMVDVMVEVVAAAVDH